MLRTSYLLLLLVAAGCGSSGLAAGPCDQVPPDPTCNIDCDPTGSTNTCPGGFYCNPDGKCDAQCTPTGGQCGDGYLCTTDGHCVPSDQVPPGGNDTCPRVNFTAKPTTPSILLLLDRSGSMGASFDGDLSRWAVVRQALTDPTTGIVSQLEAKAYFGSMIFQNIDEGTCPQLVTSPRALNNAAVIRAALAPNQNNNSGTPTAKSLEAAVATFATSPAPAGSPKIIVLATDGRPNPCNNRQDGNYPEEQLKVENTAGAAYATGIRTIPLSVATSQQDVHLQRVANRGAGVQAGQPNAPLYKGDTPANLKAAFEAIIGGAISCDLTVNGSLDQTQAAGGDVRLNDRKLTFGTDWQLVGTNIIRLLGASCTELKNTANPKVDGTFPCGVQIE